MLPNLHIVLQVLQVLQVLHKVLHILRKVLQILRKVLQILYKTMGSFFRNDMVNCKDNLIHINNTSIEESWSWFDGDSLFSFSLFQRNSLVALLLLHYFLHSFDSLLLQFSQYVLYYSTHFFFWSQYTFITRRSIFSLIFSLVLSKDGWNQNDEN